MTSWEDYPFPYTDLTAVENFYYAMEYLPSLGNATLMKWKNADVVDLLADAFLASPNANVSEVVASAYSVSVSRAAYLDWYVDGDDALRNWAIFCKYFRPDAPDYSPRLEFMALILPVSLLVLASTVLRVYSRVRLPGSRLMLSDWSLMLGCTIGLLVNFLWAADLVNLQEQGSGALWNMSFDSFKVTQILATLEQSIYHACMLALKCSILLFYLQFYGEKRVQWWVTVATLVLNVLTNSAGFFFMLLECQPVDYWNHWLTATCLTNQAQITFAIGILNIFTDVMIWLTALPTVWVLAPTWRKKILAVLVIFSGLSACVASAVRAWLLWGGNSNVSAGNMSDFNIEICTFVEINVMIICYNVPALRALVNFYLGRREQRSRALLGVRPSDIEATNTTYTYNSGSGEDFDMGKYGSSRHASTISNDYVSSHVRKLASSPSPKYQSTFYDDQASFRSRE